MMINICQEANMRKLMVFFIFVVFSLNVVFISHPYAQTENIEAVEVAKKLAEKADGVYVEGEILPALGPSQVALPVIDEESENILGYIIADKAKLIAALNESGLTEVANALGAAGDAGAAAGGTVSTGIAGGSMTTVALVIGAIVAIGIALGSGGGGGGGGSTVAHQ
jgi:hypothetical protein